MKLLAIDPSLTATGFAVLELGAETERCVDVGFVKTAPDGKGRHVYAADQDGARIDEIAAELIRLLRIHGPDVVACEAPAGSQHAKSAKALGLAYGVCRGVLRTFGLTPLMVQAHHAKKAAAGSLSASKDEVQAAMRARFPEADITGTKPRQEAIADALAVACSVLEEPGLRATRRTILASRQQATMVARAGADVAMAGGLVVDEGFEVTASECRDCGHHHSRRSACPTVLAIAAPYVGVAGDRSKPAGGNVGAAMGESACGLFGGMGTKGIERL